MYCILTTVKLLAKINKHIIENLFLPRLSNFGIKYYYAPFLKQMPNFNSLLTVTSDIDGLFARHFNS
jgi:hypothetical protein